MDMPFTVGELIAELKCFPEDMEVRMAVPMDNYWGEVQGKNITNIEEGIIRCNDTNTTCPNKILHEDNDDDNFETKKVLILE